MTPTTGGSSRQAHSNTAFSGGTPAFRQPRTGMLGWSFRTTRREFSGLDHVVAFTRRVKHEDVASTSRVQS